MWGVQNLDSRYFGFINWDALEHTSYLSQTPQTASVEKNWSCGEILPMTCFSHDKFGETLSHGEISPHEKSGKNLSLS